MQNIQWKDFSTIIQLQIPRTGLSNSIQATFQFNLNVSYFNLTRRSKSIFKLVLQVQLVVYFIFKFDTFLLSSFIPHYITFWNWSYLIGNRFEISELQGTEYKYTRGTFVGSFFMIVALFGLLITYKFKLICQVSSTIE